MTRRMKRIQSHLHVVGRVGAGRRRKGVADDLERCGVGLAIPGESSTAKASAANASAIRPANRVVS